MNYTEVTNLKWADAATSLIAADVTFEEIGTVSFTASPNDPEEHGREIFARASAGEFGSIAPYIRNIEAEWNMIRMIRNQLISASDWTQFPDAQTNLSEEKKTAWATYRQTLRDLTENYSDPKDVVWPEKP
jgi:hypothetical protein